MTDHYQVVEVVAEVVRDSPSVIQVCGVALEVLRSLPPPTAVAEVSEVAAEVVRDDPTTAQVAGAYLEVLRDLGHNRRRQYTNTHV